jgi:hypothetical protein
LTRRWGGWQEFVKALPIYLDGCLMWEDWFLAVFSPAFDANATKIYSRGCRRFSWHRKSFQRCSRASQKKAMWGAPRSISTDAQKGSNSAPSERLQPGERGFRELTAFYPLAEWLRGGLKKRKSWPQSKPLWPSVISVVKHEQVNPVLALRAGSVSVRRAGIAETVRKHSG